MIQNPWWAPWILNRIIEPLMRNQRIKIPGLAGMKVGDRALDVCCGTGALALHYARTGVTTFGIDLNPRVIEVAENKRRKRCLGNIEFLTASAPCLPFKDNLFDYASISMSLHEKEMDDRDRIITEMKRVVKEEGALVFIDYRIPLPEVPISSIVKAIEFIAGKKHRECFNDYVKQGGLDELLKRNHLYPDKSYKSGSFHIIRSPNN